jgi:glycosyltransferase involved in cell wall biosynthesis
MRVGIDARKIADFGIGTYIRGLLREIDYVVFAPRDAPVPRNLEHVVVDAPHYSIRELITLGRAADRARLDLFHAPHYVVPFTSVPVAVTIHDLIHLHQPQRNPLAPLYARTMIRRAIRKSRVVLTVSEAVKRELETELGAANVVVAPNGIDEVFTPSSTERTHFLYVGNDKPHKNVGTLVEAFARVDNAKLILAGGDFERFADRDNVIVRGFVPAEELVRLYRSAIALVMPSHEEGFGLPAAEAMACGTAVITSNAPALVEITGDAALHVDARSIDALAKAMARVASDAPLRDQLASRGVERAKNFTWERCAEIARGAFASAI